MFKRFLLSVFTGAALLSQTRSVSDPGVVKKWDADAAMPNLVLVQLPSNHTQGTTPGASSPKAMVADNDLAVGQVVDALSHSRFWNKMQIFVVEDDAQNGVDHVDGHRTVALVVGPYVSRGAVDSTFYSNPGIVATDMRASFTEKPDFTPYFAEAAKHDLFEVNPRLAAARGPARKAAAESMRMEFDLPDRAPAGKLNRILLG